MAGVKISALSTITPLNTDLVVLDRPTTGAGAPITGKATLSDLKSIVGGVASGTFNEPQPAEFVTTASVSIAGSKGFSYTADQVGTDTFFFVSGAIDGKNGASPGVAVFGGDVVVSGNMEIGTLDTVLGNDVSFFVSGIIGGKDGTDPGVTVFGGDVHISGNLTIDGTYPAGGGGGNSYWSSTQGGSIFSTGSALFRGPAGINDAPTDFGTDIFFYVSGSIGSKDTAVTGTSVFGGDIHVSGNLSSDGSATVSQLISVGQNLQVAGLLAVTGSSYLMGSITGSGGLLLTGSALFAGNGGISIGSDTVFFVSGATGNNSGKKAVFGGTAFVSGNLQVPFQTKIESRNLAGNGYLGIARYVDGGGTNLLLVGDSDGNNNGVAIKGEGVGSGQLAGVLALITGSSGGFFSGSYQFPQGISGSLTKLTDGSSYLIAGTNVTISTGTNGAVTISSAGGAEQYWFSTVNEAVYTTGSTLFSGPGGVGVDSPALLGSDMFFFVSGAIGSKDTNVTGTAVFGGDVVASGTMNLEGGLRTPPTIVTSLPYTASITDYIIAVSASAGPGVALPSTALDGRNYIVKDVSGSAAVDNIVVSVDGGGLIDGASSYTLSINRGSATFVYFGTSIGWGVI